MSVKERFFWEYYHINKSVDRVVMTIHCFIQESIRALCTLKVRETSNKHSDWLDERTSCTESVRVIIAQQYFEVIVESAVDSSTTREPSAGGNLKSHRVKISRKK